jgi:hypothetical protein
MRLIRCRNVQARQQIRAIDWVWKRPWKNRVETINFFGFSDIVSVARFDNMIRVALNELQVDSSAGRPEIWPFSSLCAGPGPDGRFVCLMSNEFSASI